MEKIIKVFTLCVILSLTHNPSVVWAQKVDDERMNRDIAVAENVLSTLIKQEINQPRAFLGFEIKGNYQPGYGVIFRLPSDYTAPIVMSMGAANIERRAFVWDNGQGYTYTYNGEQEDNKEIDEIEKENDRTAYRLRTKMKDKKRLEMDSLHEQYNTRIIKAAKDFIADYSDLVSQLAPTEKIVITNQSEQHKGLYFNSGKRTHISVEALKSDISTFKQGKGLRDQLLSKIKVINTVSVAEKEPDMELLSSIFSRLYRADLSKTFFTEDNIYYERLKDYGVIYYMQVFSTTLGDFNNFSMPTVNLKNIDQETRDKKVIELYPKFEKELKENMLEYGRTVKSLGENEMLIFTVALTKCKGCNIPASLELSVKGSVLKDFNAGKIDKSSALTKFTIKKGANQ
jgi:hypothetical protein